MKWFKPQYSVCKECAVHFEPRNDRWADLCLEHRKPVMERDIKRDAVTQWARENWEKLYEQYEQYEKDDSAKRAAFNAINQAGMNSMAIHAQQAAMAQSNIYGLGGLGQFR